MSQLVRRQSQLAGILYLVTHVTSVSAVIAYGGGFVRAGVALELVLAFGCLGTGVLLWVLLQARGPARVASFALLRTLEAAVIVAGALPMLGAALAGTAVDGASAATHTAAFLLGQGLVISVNTVILGWLLWDARAVPRAIAALGMTGGMVVLVSNGLQLAGAIPLNGVVAAIAAVPVFAFEIWFAVWLIAVGVRPDPGICTAHAADAVVG
ncbi:DUF4386 domain-containing protein [Microbacterium laevaniformans]|uniref:DUF4386 domain-containing protein n=1 Tax=Microbacterium laevaniformans TaxID=36807 RepID=A0A4S2D1D8_9MICO|nr:DUF4386 domain-containing protein [Microbacterium laevaniformans]TGY34303.1 DUF4386 domain-containing protein [Microbacterium laevaniformans]